MISSTCSRKNRFVLSLQEQTIIVDGILHHQRMIVPLRSVSKLHMDSALRRVKLPNYWIHVSWYHQISLIFATRVPWTSGWRPPAAGLICLAWSPLCNITREGNPTPSLARYSLVWCTLAVMEQRFANPLSLIYRTLRSSHLLFIIDWIEYASEEFIAHDGLPSVLDAVSRL